MVGSNGLMNDKNKWEWWQISYPTLHMAQALTSNAFTMMSFSNIMHPISFTMLPIYNGRVPF